MALGACQTCARNAESTHCSRTGLVSKLVISAYRGALPLWTTTCHIRCESTRNRDATVQRHTHLGGRIREPVRAAVHQQHVAVGIVGELEPGAHDPTLVIGVEAVVVVAVEARKRRVVVLRLQLDHPHAAEVGADPVDVAAQRRCDLRVRRPQRVLVGLALVPEPAAVELAIG